MQELGPQESYVERSGTFKRWGLVKDNDVTGGTALQKD